MAGTTQSGHDYNTQIVLRQDSIQNVVEVFKFILLMVRCCGRVEFQVLVWLARFSLASNMESLFHQQTSFLSICLFVYPFCHKDISVTIVVLSFHVL